MSLAAGNVVQIGDWGALNQYNPQLESPDWAGTLSSIVTGGYHIFQHVSSDIQPFGLQLQSALGILTGALADQTSFFVTNLVQTTGITAGEACAVKMGLFFISAGSYSNMSQDKRKQLFSAGLIPESLSQGRVSITITTAQGPVVKEYQLAAIPALIFGKTSDAGAGGLGRVYNKAVSAFAPIVGPLLSNTAVTRSLTLMAVMPEDTTINNFCDVFKTQVGELAFMKSTESLQKTYQMWRDHTTSLHSEPALRDAYKAFIDGVVYYLENKPLFIDYHNLNQQDANARQLCLGADGNLNAHGISAQAAYGVLAKGVRPFLKFVMGVKKQQMYELTPVQFGCSEMIAELLMCKHASPPASKATLINCIKQYPNDFGMMPAHAARM